MRWEQEYSPEDESATRARKDAALALADAGLDPSVLDDVHLVIGELVSNAIRHAATELTLVLDINGSQVRVGVFDRDTRPPAVLAADAGATSGRGLLIVASIARAWGYEAVERDGITGKRVWADIGATPGCEAPARLATGALPPL
jgi:anti-sigma regulatory factor (Ser/Thr protein kinase)